MSAHFPSLIGAAGSFWLDAALKGALVLAAAWALTRLARRAASATRHVTWFLAMVAILVLPVLSHYLPAWQQPLWTVSRASLAADLPTITLQLAPGLQPKSNPAVGNDSAKLPLVTLSAPAKTRIEVPVTTLGILLALAVWAAGVGFLWAYAALGWWQLRRLRQGAQVVKDAAWTELASRVCRELGLSRRVTLLRAEGEIMPATWGAWRLVVLLPASADGWTEERRRLVLWHELAHGKRWDCLTQGVTHAIGALHWFNPLAWLAAREMRAERERACDDLVLAGGARASNYSEHLVEIARRFQRLPAGAAIAMARTSAVGGRVRALIDSRRSHGPLSLAAAVVLAVFIFGFAAAVAANKAGENPVQLSKYDSRRFDPQLKAFFAAKEKQARAVVKEYKLEVEPEAWEYFAAGASGEWVKVGQLYAKLNANVDRLTEWDKNHEITGEPMPPAMFHFAAGFYVRQTDGAYEAFASGDRKYLKQFAQDIIRSIPVGSIYFGGTDAGWSMVSLYQDSEKVSQTFFTLTQNHMANNTYFECLRVAYGKQIHIPTPDETAVCFNEYVSDATQRARHDKQFPSEPKQLKSGENVEISDSDGRTLISGRPAVMEINGLLAKVIADKNPSREVFIEEGMPIEGIYSQLEPHGLILKFNRQPSAALSEAMVKRDQQYWAKYLKPLMGEWLQADTKLERLADFVEAVDIARDLARFKGDTQFITDDYSRRWLSKMRVAIAGVYAWRAKQATDTADKMLLEQAADLAFRQAWVLCPYSPEPVMRYVELLTAQKRLPEAARILECSAQVAEAKGQDASLFHSLLETIQKQTGK